MSAPQAFAYLEVDAKENFNPIDAVNDEEILELTHNSSVLNESDIIYMILTERFSFWPICFRVWHYTVSSGLSDLKLRRRKSSGLRGLSFFICRLSFIYVCVIIYK